jgi:hypothetical protein
MSFDRQSLPVIAWESNTVLRTLWNYFSPFAVLKDVSRGTVDEKAAAYRYNYEMRGCLLGYIRRWLWTGVLALMLTAFFDSQSPHDGTFHFMDLLATAPALFATVATCGIIVLGYAYVFLSWNEVPAVDRRPVRAHEPMKWSDNA